MYVFTVNSAFNELMKQTLGCVLLNRLLIVSVHLYKGVLSVR